MTGFGLLLFLAAVSTLLGGFFGIRFYHRLPILLATGSGALVGAAVFELLPTALATAHAAALQGRVVFEYAGLGVLFSYYVHRDVASDSVAAPLKRTAGRMTASLLVLHSIFDGALIATSAHLSRKAGLMAGAAVVTHDLCDGLNVMLASSRYEKPASEDYLFLVVNSAAPIVAGTLAWALIPFEPAALTLVLSLAAGSFLCSAWVHLFVQKHRLTGVWSARAGLVVVGAGLVWITLRVLRAAS